MECLPEDILRVIFLIVSHDSWLPILLTCKTFHRVAKPQFELREKQRNVDLYIFGGYLMISFLLLASIRRKLATSIILRHQNGVSVGP